MPARVHIATRLDEASFFSGLGNRSHITPDLLLTSASPLYLGHGPRLSFSFLPTFHSFLLLSLPVLLCCSPGLRLFTMSDPEPSTAPCSSSPPSTQASDSTAALNYAFLVHSQKTLTQNLPPRVDNKLLARQKRRRTRYARKPIPVLIGPMGLAASRSLTRHCCGRIAPKTTQSLKPSINGTRSQTKRPEPV